MLERVCYLLLLLFWRKRRGKVKKLGVQCVKFKTRKRLGVDGGQSVLAVRE
jgi:hypothetical protein